MAYGSYTSPTWVQVWTNNYYSLDVYVRWRVDRNARKIQVEARRERIRSIRSGYGFTRSGINAGYGVGSGVVDTDPSGSVTVSPNGSYLHLASGDRAVSHVADYNEDGTLPSITAHVQWITGASGSNNVPERNWVSTSLVSRLPTIDPKIVGASNVNIANVTSASFDVSWTQGTQVTTYQIKVTGSDGTENTYEVASSENTYTITDLTPNTEYTVSIRATNNYEQSDWTDGVVATTTEGQASIYLNVNGQTKKSKVFLNVNGKTKKVKGVFVKVNGETKKAL